MARPIKDLAASVRQRLLDRARVSGRPFAELLQYFAMERFLYRLSRSEHVDKFVLKGALLLTAWRAPLSRPTKDTDLLGRTSNKPDVTQEVIRDVCLVETRPDGIVFDPKTVAVKRIKEDAGYEGVRTRFRGDLSDARVSMQIDVGFGDDVYPGPQPVEYLTILDFPSPVLPAYSAETVVAEIGGYLKP